MNCHLRDEETWRSFRRYPCWYLSVAAYVHPPYYYYPPVRVKEETVTMSMGMTAKYLMFGVEACVMSDNQTSILSVIDFF